MWARSHIGFCENSLRMAIENGNIWEFYKINRRFCNNCGNHSLNNWILGMLDNITNFRDSRFPSESQSSCDSHFHLLLPTISSKFHFFLFLFSWFLFSIAFGFEKHINLLFNPNLFYASVLCILYCKIFFFICKKVFN